MSPKQIVYALLAVAGLVATAHFNLQFGAVHGSFDLGAFFAGGFANPAAASLTSDLTVAFLAFLVWLPGEARRVGLRHWWIFAALGCLVAFAFAFPLFLLVRDRRLAAQVVPSAAS